MLCHLEAKVSLFPFSIKICKCGPNLDTEIAVEVFVELYVYTPLTPTSFFLAIPF